MLAANYDASQVRIQIRNWTIFFMIALAISGITAFPLQSELLWLSRQSGLMPSWLSEWVSRVKDGVVNTNTAYPFISYGTDWLAFAHIIIAMLFIGILKDPVRNKWIIDWAMICCILVFPVALIAGPIRDIPLYHQVIDCCFGVFGLIPLWMLRKKIVRLEEITG